MNKYIVLSVFLLLLIANLGSYYLGKQQPYYGKTAQEWANEDNSNLVKVANLPYYQYKDTQEQKKITTLRDMPTPTPQVIYHTNTVTQVQTQYVDEPEDPPTYHCTTNDYEIPPQETCTPY